MINRVTLRGLRSDDAPAMLEWMKDPSCSENFRFDPDKATMESVLEYIAKSSLSSRDRHYAVTDGRDGYMGTISLKNIDENDLSAEYAIALHPNAMGKGVGTAATKEILRVAFDELGLHRVYLNVYPENKRAVAMYEKCGFRFEGEFREHIFVRGQFRNLLWYSLLRDEYEMIIK